MNDQEFIQDRIETIREIAEGARLLHQEAAPEARWPIRKQTKAVAGASGIDGTCIQDVA